MSTIIVSTCLQAAPAETQLSWTPADMMKVKMFSDVQVSPENDTVLFVATESIMTEDKSINVSRIYKADASGAVAFSTSDCTSFQPRWSPDGKWIAFLSNRNQINQLYLIRSDGGEAVPLTNGKKDVQTFSWSPDSQKIAFVMEEELDHRKRPSGALVYKQDTKINRLWMIDITTKEKATSLTNDDYCVRGCGDFGTTNSEFDWSPDSKSIVFAYTSALGLDHFHLDSSLAILDLSSKTITPFEKNAVFEAMPRFSPDGKWIAYVSSDSPKRYAINRRVAIRAADGTQTKYLAKTKEEGAFLAGVNLLGWSHDGKNVIFYEPSGTKFQIVFFPIDGSSPKELDSSNCYITMPSLSYDRTTLGYVQQAVDSPPEVYLSKLGLFEPMQMSDLNREFLDYPKIKTEVISWKAPDGLNIEGLLTYPVGYKEGKQYPLLLVIHGGPMAFFDESYIGSRFIYPYAAFAQEGFMILRPNPRGSCGYGKTFREANYEDWGGMDYKDIMAGVDHLVEKNMADPARLGVMGWSYGGYMSAWTVTQTNRFKAASIGAACINLVSLAGTTDLHRFMHDYLGDFVGNRELYDKRSPINYVQNVTTPCLIQHGDADARVPVTQAYEFYHALDRLGKNPLLMVYPGMGHRIHNPKMMLDCMEQNLTWFSEHMK